MPSLLQLYYHHEVDEQEFSHGTFSTIVKKQSFLILFNFLETLIQIITRMYIAGEAQINKNAQWCESCFLLCSLLQKLKDKTLNVVYRLKTWRQTTEHLDIL